MKLSRLAITPLAFACLVAACTGDDVSSVESISTVADSTTQAPTTNQVATTVVTEATAPPSGDVASDLPTEVCLARLQEAMGDGTPADFVEAYYPALSECSGLEDFLAAVDQTGFDPGMDPTEWAADVCGLDGPMIRPTCEQAMATAQGNN